MNTDIKGMIKSIRILEERLLLVSSDETKSEWVKTHEMFDIQQTLLILRQTLVDMVESQTETKQGVLYHIADYFKKAA